MSGRGDLSHRGRLPLKRLLPLLLLLALLVLSIGSWACGGAGTSSTSPVRPASSVTAQAPSSTTTVSSTTNVAQQSGVASSVLRKGPYLMYTGDDTSHGGALADGNGCEESHGGMGVEYVLWSRTDHGRRVVYGHRAPCHGGSQSPVDYRPPSRPRPPGRQGGPTATCSDTTSPGCSQGPRSITGSSSTGRRLSARSTRLHRPALPRQSCTQSATRRTIRKRSKQVIKALLADVDTAPAAGRPYACTPGISWARGWSRTPGTRVSSYSRPLASAGSWGACL